jgi:hypothetical protein
VSLARAIRSATSQNAKGPCGSLNESLTRSRRLLLLPAATVVLAATVLLVVLGVPAFAAADSGGVRLDAVPTRVETVNTAISLVQTISLAQPAEHVAVYWRGNSDAYVTLAFSSDGTNFGDPIGASRDDLGEQLQNGMTYGAVLIANDAKLVRITSDRPLAQLTVLGISDGTPITQTSVSAAAAYAATSQPTVISRDQWGANPTYMTWDPEYHQTRKLIVHHTATSNNYVDRAAAESYIRSIYYYHAVTMGWGDIAYNFLIDKFGNVYEGRYSRDYGGANPTGDGPVGPWSVPASASFPAGVTGDFGGVTGGHTYGWNSGTMGVAMLGTYTTSDITPEARAALVALLAWEAGRNGIEPLQTEMFTNPVDSTTITTPNIGGHLLYRATECPGAKLNSDLQSIRDDVSALVAPAPPTVTALSPVFGPATGGAVVTITGTDFLGASGVTFGGTPATAYTVDSATQITVTAPAHAGGSVQVQVTTPHGSSADTAADDYTYQIAYSSIRGTDRFDTALKVSQAMFPGPLPAGSGVVLAPGWESYQEALCGAPLAAAWGGPVLLSSKTTLYGNVKAELQRLAPQRVFLIGLSSTLAAAVRSALPAATVTSINGTGTTANIVYDMSYRVAQALAEKVGDLSGATAIITTGANFPDAIGVSPLACAQKWPIVLTGNGATLHPKALATFTELGITHALKVGTYVPDPPGVTGVGNCSGADRYYTNANLAAWARAHAGLSFAHTGFATGDKFPDALAAGPYLAQDQGILLLSPLLGPLPPAIAATVTANRAEARHVTFIACVQPVIGQVKALLP